MKVPPKFTPQKPHRMAIIATSSAIALSMGSFLIEFLPHSFFLDKYKNLIHLERLGIPVQLDTKIVNLFDKVMEDLKVSEHLKKKFEAFAITGFNLHHAGFPDSRFGAIVGIPNHFTYQEKSDVDYVDIRLGYDRKPLNLYHPATENLINSLVLSEKAKKFGIAREVLMSQKQLPLYKSLESPAVITLSVLGAELLRTKMKLHNKPWTFTILTYLATSTVAYAIWFQIRDSLKTYYEKSVDEQLAKLGKEYIEGGKEFYDKLISRNIALRALLGPQGAKTFNRDGDEQFLIRVKTVPLSQRKKFFYEFKEENES
ncbi:hypothetical protein TKK_0012530 [Trichogramma kaykai]|uniref:Transmembrane protein 177 n=1 Tax=Trichogramma kaykai TaxID=54128 RepID=A0ABD2WMY0_9HYME